MKHYLLTLGMALCVAQGHAQISAEDKEDFEAFRSSLYEDFEDFRRKINEEFVEFLRNPWESHDDETPIEQPKDDERPPVIYDSVHPDYTPPVNPTIPQIDEVITPPSPTPQPQPVAPIEESPMPVTDYYHFTFLGTDLKVRLSEDQKFTIGRFSEKNVANAMEKLIDESYDNLIIDCLAIREKLQLNDWAYLQMIDALCQKFCEQESCEAELLTAYLLLQSGYRVRLAHNGSHLYTMFGCDQIIYERPWYNLEGNSYYSLRNLPAPLYISDAKFPNEQNLSLVFTREPLVEEVLSSPRTIKSERYAEMQMTVQVNKNLLNFYNTYPSAKMADSDLWRWAMYANTPISHIVREQTYPKLRESLKGLPQKEATERLLNLVQTGFVYEYDDKVWGHDRAFFSEETLYYPYCDCEDRSILFTRLVRDLLGLKCMLVYYPGHLAAAVQFPGATYGDYIVYNGQSYTIADPTFIGAPVGHTMPGMNNSTASVIVLQ